MDMQDARTVAQSIPPQSISEEVLREKYAKGEERSVDDVRRRVANALAQVEPRDREHWQQSFIGRRRTVSFRADASTPPRELG